MPPLATGSTNRTVYVCDYTTQLAIHRAPKVALRLARQIVECEKSDESTIVTDYRQSTDAALCHDLCRVIYVVLRTTAYYAPSHGACHSQSVQRTTLRISRHADVAIGQKPDWVELFVHHRDRAGCVFPHDLRCFVKRVVWVASSDVMPHHSLDFHFRFPQRIAS